MQSLHQKKKGADWNKDQSTRTVCIAFFPLTLKKVFQLRDVEWCDQFAERNGVCVWGGVGWSGEVWGQMKGTGKLSGTVMQIAFILTALHFYSFSWC